MCICCWLRQLLQELRWEQLGLGIDSIVNRIPYLRWGTTLLFSSWWSYSYLAPAVFYTIKVGMPQGQILTLVKRLLKYCMASRHNGFNASSWETLSRFLGLDRSKTYSAHPASHPFSLWRRGDLIQVRSTNRICSSLAVCLPPGIVAAWGGEGEEKAGAWCGVRSPSKCQSWWAPRASSHFSTATPTLCMDSMQTCLPIFGIGHMLNWVSLKFNNNLGLL